MTIDPLYFALAYCGFIGAAAAWWIAAARLNDRYDRTST